MQFLVLRVGFRLSRPNVQGDDAQPHRAGIHMSKMEYAPFNMG